MAQLRRSARRRAQDHDDLADDLVQETLIRAWANRDRFAEGTNMGAWLHTILRNTDVSHIRKASREQVGLAEGWEDLLTRPANQLEHVALVEVAAAMTRLPSDDRAILIALGVEGRPHEEVALETGCAMGTVRSRLSRARARLRDILDDGIGGMRVPTGFLRRRSTGPRHLGA